MFTSKCMGPYFTLKCSIYQYLIGFEVVKLIHGFSYFSIKIRGEFNGKMGIQWDLKYLMENILPILVKEMKVTRLTGKFCQLPD